MNSFLVLIFTITCLLNYLFKNKYPFSLLFSFYWFLNVLISFLFFPDFIFSNFLLLFLIISSISIFIGERVGSFTIIKNNNSLWFNLSLINKIFFIVFLFSMLFPIINLSNYGFNLFDISSLKSLLEINNKIANLRYLGKIETTFTSQILLSLTYLLPFIGGFLYFHLNKKKFIILSILPQLLIMLSQNTKVSFIAAVLIFISCLTACNIIFTNKIYNFSFKKIILASLIGLLFYSLFIFSFAARRGELNAKVISESKNKISNYIAHVPALDVYLNSEKVINYSFGLKTFYGISNYLGILKRKGGIFTDFIDFKSENKKFKTNIFTVFRLLIADFGVKGSIIFLSFLSFLFGFFRVNNIKFKSFSICLISTFIFFILYSFVSSVFAYMSYIFSFIMFFLVLKIGSFKYKI